MQFYTDRVTDQYGNVKSGTSVLVLLNGSPATIYADNGVTTKANPMTTGADGSFSFYAANGTYTISVGNSSKSVTLFDVVAASTATPTSSSTVLGETAGVVRRFAVDELVPVVSVFQYMTAAQVADVRARTALLDVAAALQAAMDSGSPLEFPAGTYSHSGLSLTTAGNVDWRGSAAVLAYTGAGVGVLVQSANNTDATGCRISGITCTGGTAALKVQGQGTGVFRDIDIDGCAVKDTTSGALWVYHGDGVRIVNSRAENAGDNGVYVEFSKNVAVSHNTIRNCKGSAGIVVCYSDATVACSGVSVTDNLIFCDDDATVGSYIAGVQVGYVNGATVSGNTIGNYQAAPAIDKSIKTGVLVDEWVSSDVAVFGNNIVSPWEYGVRAGTDANAEIRRLHVHSNKVYDAGLVGMTFTRVPEGLTVERNLIDGADQQGVYVAASCYNSTVCDNELRHVGVQPTFANHAAIEVAGHGFRVIGNRLYGGADAMSVNAAGRVAPEYAIDPTAQTLTLREGGVDIDVFDYSYAGCTFEDVRAWIATHTGWSAPAGVAGALSEVPATRLRRTGPRNAATVGYYSANGWTYITSAEPKYFVVCAGNEGEVFGNRWTSYAIEFADSFDGTRKLFSIGSDAMTDTNEYGARSFMGASTAALPYRWYVLGDRLVNSAPAAGQPKAWVCTVAGKTGTWVSEGNL